MICTDIKSRAILKKNSKNDEDKSFSKKFTKKRIKNETRESKRDCTSYGKRIL